MLRRAAVAALFLFSASLLARPVEDPLAAMRQAMGGDAALSAIRTLAIEGSSSSREGGGPLAMELRFELPDKFVRISRQFFSAGPGGQQTMTSTYGYNAGQLVAFIENTMGADLPPFPDMAGASTAAEQSALIRRHTDEEHGRMLQWTLPLLGGGNADPGFTVGASHDDTLDGKSVRVVDLTRWDGMVLHLTIDAATNLPARLAWMDRVPEKWTLTSSSTVTVRGGQASQPSSTSTSPAMRAGRPADGQPTVEHAIAMDQFKADKGLTWPRRFIGSIDGKVTVETKVTKFSINPKFGKDAFLPR